MSNLKKSTKRNVIIAVVVVLLCVVFAICYGFYAKDSADSSNSGKEAANTKYVDPDTYKQGRGFYVSADGVGVLKKGVPTLEIYMDFTCPHCINFEYKYGDEINKLVSKGEINVIYRPVNVLNQGYSKYVSSAMIDVLESKDKDKFPAFQAAVVKNIYNYLQTKDEKLSSTDMIGTLAKSVGISDDVVAKFANKSNINYIDKTIKMFTNRDIFSGEDIAVPAFVLNGKVMDYEKITTTKSLESFIKDNK